MTQNTIPNRNTIGRTTGWVGIGGNLLLVLIKLAIGYFSNSIAIISDALNNLTDCASSFIMIFGFSLSTKSKDQLHPYGHGRMEYICGFVIANFIIVTAILVGKNAIGRLINPQVVHVSNLVVFTLIIGILIKLGMAWFVKQCNQKIASPALKAIEKDNFSDSLVTAVTLLGILLVPFTTMPIDGILGILVSLFILYSGLNSLGENFTLLLGEGMDPTTEARIRQMLSEYALFKDIELMTLHDYGPDEKVAFIKVTFREFPNSPNAIDILEKVRQRLKVEVRLDATLYWDSI